MLCGACPCRRRRNLSFGAFADLGAMGLLIGQAVGRWGNFMNREAFGSETTAPVARMERKITDRSSS